MHTVEYLTLVLSVCSRWLPDEDFVSSTLDSFVGNAYVYGREWISSKVMNLTSQLSVLDKLTGSCVMIMTEFLALQVFS